MNEIILNFGETEPTTVKTISAAWNFIRGIRDNTPAEELNGKLLRVTLPEGMETKRIPETIFFRMNKKGKIEFKDADKLAERQAKQILAEMPAEEEKEAIETVA